MNLFRNIKKNYVIITILIFVILASTMHYAKPFIIIEGTSNNNGGLSTGWIIFIVIMCVFVGPFILLGIGSLIYYLYTLSIKSREQSSVPVQPQSSKPDYAANTNRNNYRTK